MKVTTTVNLNVRVGAPRLDAPCYQYIAPGSELEVDGKFYEGDYFEGINTWMKDEAGNYYWSGGVKDDTASKIVNSSNYPQWMLDLRIPELWEKTTGKGVGIAVVDTGINLKNSDLPFNKKKFYSYDSKVSLEDLDGHGTHCAGLIAARNNKTMEIGVAPDSTLFICKISDGQSLEKKEMSRYADAIDWCTKQNDIHIISISWGSFIRDQSIIAQIQTSINSAVQNNKIVVCAVGDASDFVDDSQLYPACLNNTIGVGSIPVIGKLYPYVNSFLTTITYGYEIKSYGKITDEIATLSGTSQSTAIVAGLIALKIQNLNYSFQYSTIKDFIKNISISTNYGAAVMPTINGDLLIKHI